MDVDWLSIDYDAQALHSAETYTSTDPPSAEGPDPSDHTQPTLHALDAAPETPTAPAAPPEPRVEQCEGTTAARAPNDAAAPTPKLKPASAPKLPTDPRPACAPELSPRDTPTKAERTAATTRRQYAMLAAAIVAFFAFGAALAHSRARLRRVEATLVETRRAARREALRGFEREAANARRARELGRRVDELEDTVHPLAPNCAAAACGLRSIELGPVAGVAPRDRCARWPAEAARGERAAARSRDDELWARFAAGVAGLDRPMLSVEFDPVTSVGWRRWPSAHDHARAHRAARAELRELVDALFGDGASARERMPPARTAPADMGAARTRELGPSRAPRARARDLHDFSDVVCAAIDAGLRKRNDAPATSISGGASDRAAERTAAPASAAQDAPTDTTLAPPKEMRAPAPPSLAPPEPTHTPAPSAPAPPSEPATAHADQRVPDQPTAQTREVVQKLRSYSIKQLRAVLESHGVECKTCVEKDDLVARVLGIIENPTAA